MVAGLISEMHDDGVLAITFDRPERRNAFDQDMAAELLRLFTQDAHLPPVRALILKGNGPHFCAGFDLKSRPASRAPEGIGLVASAYQALADVPVLSVALVDGSAFGGAIGFVAACDMVIATRSAQFACPEARHGVLPGAMAVFLTQAIGPRRATSMIATAAPIPAERAYVWGLVSELVDDAGALESREKSMIQEILQTAPATARQVKALVRLAAPPSIPPQVIAEAVALASASRAGDEAREGITAFRERRRPAWVHKA